MKMLFKGVIHTSLSDRAHLLPLSLYVRGVSEVSAVSSGKISGKIGSGRSRTARECMLHYVEMEKEEE